MNRRTISIIAVIILIIAIGVGVFLLKNSEDESTAEMKTIQLNEVTRSVFYAPQYVAISNGFFEKEGLEIEITTGQGAETPLPR